HVVAMLLDGAECDHDRVAAGVQLAPDVRPRQRVQVECAHCCPPEVAWAAGYRRVRSTGMLVGCALPPRGSALTMTSSAPSSPGIPAAPVPSRCTEKSEDGSGLSDPFLSSQTW